MTQQDYEYLLVKDNLGALLDSCLGISPQGVVATLATFIEEYSEKSGVSLEDIKTCLDLTVFEGVGDYDGMA